MLFLCVGNSARSQMAEAILEHRGGERFDVESAGTNATAVNPLTVAVLAEIGIDWSGARSKPVTEFLGQSFDLVITVCDEAREACPVFPGATRQLHWSFRDPAAVVSPTEARLAAFRAVRDEIDRAIRTLVASDR
ncbi:MAG TPA: arsenate reductase ArsC [Candidatus Limnocylindrales bacterium]|nr:arsenate reductase ArsC [Candidatus Limnocylindrales bacterium]